MLLIVFFTEFVTVADTVLIWKAKKKTKKKKIKTIIRPHKGGLSLCCRPVNVFLTVSYPIKEGKAFNTS